MKQEGLLSGKMRHGLWYPRNNTEDFFRQGSSGVMVMDEAAVGQREMMLFVFACAGNKNDELVNKLVLFLCELMILAEI